MNATLQRIGILMACLVLGIVAVRSQTAATAAANDTRLSAFHVVQPEMSIGTSWDQKAAATYLDRREGWWMGWPRAARDHETFCVSCHTALPYALSRPALRKALTEDVPSLNERRLLENVTKRVRLWKEVAPYYSDADRGTYKTVESRGTESVLNALILASHDAPSGRLSDDTRTALDNMWAEQQTSGIKQGAWLWLRFGNEPWEADDSDYYGTALAAVAVATAPGNYRARPQIQQKFKLLRDFLNRECAGQPAVNRVVLLWASAKVPGLLDPQQQKAMINEVLGKQQADGGWSLAALMEGWQRADGTPQEVNSDGYATGLISYVLQQAEIPRDNTQLKRGLAWLAKNQNKTEGYWLGYSLNKNEEHHLSPNTASFMTDAATAYAVLALTEAERH